MASRNIDDLQPAFAEKVRALVNQAGNAGLDLLVYCTYRSPEEQARLYRQSRSTDEILKMIKRLREEFGRPDLAEILKGVGPQHGAHVTNAAPGQSIHQYRCAIDAVPLRGGKPVWSAEEEADLRLWKLYGAIARDHLGLEWAGDWENFPEFPHVQAPDCDWRKLIRETA